MKIDIILSIVISLFSLTACSQNNANKQAAKQPHIGGNCEGCEAIYESPIALNRLSWIDTLPDFNEPGPKIMLSGTIYKADSKTPAPGVVLYVYHTDQTGRYTNRDNEKGWAARHGYIRGWVKSNEKGQYRFYTLRPASYPNSTALQHIHPTILEPGLNEYWIDEFIFDDDPNLTTAARTAHPQRGGDGIIKLKNENGILVGQRDIYLGRNIPGYPADEKAVNKTGSSNIDRDLNASLIPDPDTIIR
jgi:protocatechuate 3,4-dioxygenase, beta subunit